MLEAINQLKEGKREEIQLNAGQGIMYDQMDDTFYLVNFEDEEHTCIDVARSISPTMAYHLACVWLDEPSSVA